MPQLLSQVSPDDFNAANIEEFALTFVQDFEYEFVGGGNAVNGF